MILIDHRDSSHAGTYPYHCGEILTPYLPYPNLIQSKHEKKNFKIRKNVVKATIIMIFFPDIADRCLTIFV